MGDSLESVQSHFSVLDYGLFFFMLSVSGGIGVYYGFFAKQKQNNTEEYILGSKQMKVFPIAASLISSHISGITMLAVPADVYANGTQYVMSCIPMIVVAVALNYLYLPVFYDLGFVSCFTYLEKRFGKGVKLTGSLVYALDRLLFLPIIVYIPALALNQVSGFDIHYISVAICILCIFYTSVGGFRAVVWTDAIQFISMMGSVIAMVVFGTWAVGTPSEVFNAAERGDRLVFFNMNPNPLVKSTFWSVSIGFTVMWLSQKSANQGTIQKCLSLPDIGKAKQCVWYFSLGTILLKTCSCYIGILMYAIYENCDPFQSGLIKKLDQILPYFTMDISKKIYGLPGLFIAGIFSAALATMSSSLNCLSGTIFEDIIKPYATNLDEKSRSNIMKIIVVCLGIIEVSLVFVVERLGTMMRLAYSIHGLTAGTILATFTIGMLSRRVNTKGIISGAIIAILCVGTLLIGAQLSPKAPTLRFNTDECDNMPANSTSYFNEIWQKKFEEHEDVYWLFRISFMYYSLIGFTITALVAYPVSILTGECGYVDEKLLAPFLRAKKSDINDVKYNTVDIALKKVVTDNEEE